MNVSGITGPLDLQIFISKTQRTLSVVMGLRLVSLVTSTAGDSRMGKCRDRHLDGVLVGEGVHKMVRLSLAKLAATVGGMGLAFAAASGVASADPMDAVINTTCTYPQVMAALNATNPAAAAKFNNSPMAQGWLNSFLAAGPAERQAKVNELQSYPGAAKYVGVVQQVATVCNNY